MHIRAMDAGDLDRVVEIEAASFADPWSRALIVAELGNGLARPLVAEVAGRVEGFIFAWIVADEVHILDLAVDPALRGNRIGSELTLAALKSGQREDAAYAVLEVRRSNAAARRLYATLGFRVVGRRPGYYQDNGEDALVMMADLDGGKGCAC